MQNSNEAAAQSHHQKIMNIMILFNLHCVSSEGAVWLLTHPVAAAALIIFLWVLVEAVCLMAFGATLGKWAFGIRVLDAGGKNFPSELRSPVYGRCCYSGKH
jgi:uncharacterized RDD family membrane protein YckC